MQPVTSLFYHADVSIGRPDNTTQYTAGDAIGIADAGTPANAGSAIVELPLMGPPGGIILLTAMDLMVYVASAPAGMSNFVANLFNAAPTAILDNAAWSLGTADRSKYLGSVIIGTPAVTNMGVTPTTIQVCTDRTSHLGLWKLAAGQTSLWMVMTTSATYTPSALTVKRLRAWSTGV
jgi:hypothetical protein